MEPEILIVRMRSGEDVISQVVDNGDSYTLTKPAMLVPAGKGNLGMLPWLMYGDIEGGIIVPKDATFFTFKPLKDLGEEYRSGFVSNLVTPSKKIATPGLKLVTD
jgi:hypothetical protein